METFFGLDTTPETVNMLKSDRFGMETTIFPTIATCIAPWLKSDRFGMETTEHQYFYLII